MLYAMIIIIVCYNIFLVFACALCSFLCQMSTKWPLSYFQPIWVAIFVTIATVKVK